MNESPLQKLADSQHRWLIVAIVTIIFGLLVMIPLVDVYFDKKESRSTLTEELDVARLTAEKLPEFEKRVARITSELEQIESREVTEETVSRYRSSLVEMVREAGCQVRRIDVSLPATRAWIKDDDPLEGKVVSGAPNTKTPFHLETRSVALQVGGTMENVQGLLKQLYKDNKFAYPRRVELQSTNSQDGDVTLELEMWLFALERHRA